MEAAWNWELHVDTSVTLSWNNHGLSQIQGEKTKIPSLIRTSIREFGAMFSNHYKYSLNLKSCPQTIIILEEGVLTQDL